MRKLLLAVVLCLVLPASAEAHSDPLLTFASAEAAMRARAALDHPTSVNIYGCHRFVRTSITCTIHESSAHTLIEDNGVDIIGDLTYTLTATLSKAHMIVH